MVADFFHPGFWCCLQFLAWRPHGGWWHGGGLSQNGAPRAVSSRAKSSPYRAGTSSSYAAGTSRAKAIETTRSSSVAHSSSISSSISTTRGASIRSDYSWQEKATKVTQCSLSTSSDSLCLEHNLSHKVVFWLAPTLLIQILAWDPLSSQSPSASVDLCNFLTAFCCNKLVVETHIEPTLVMRLDCGFRSQPFFATFRQFWLQVHLIRVHLGLCYGTNPLF